MVRLQEFKMTRCDGTVDVIMGRSVSKHFYVRKASHGTWGRCWALCHKPTGAIMTMPKRLVDARLLAREAELWIPARVLGLEEPSAFRCEMDTRPEFVSYFKVYAYSHASRFNEFLGLRRAAV